MLYILISSASFGAMAVLVRAAYADGMDTITLLFLRFLIATICLCIVMHVRGTPLPRGRYLGIAVLMGAVGYAGQSFCYFAALHYASAGLVAVLAYLYPAIVSVLAVLFLREAMTRTKLAALGLAMVGCAFTIGPAGDAKPLGILLSVASALIYAIYIIVGTRLLKHLSPLQSTTVVAASATVVFGIATMVNGVTLPASAQGWLATLAIALISTVIAILTFLAGLERVGPVNAATLCTAEPLVTLVLARVFLGEQITPSRMVGAIMILAAVALLARSGLTVEKTAPVASKI